MTSSISLASHERNVLLEFYRSPYSRPHLRLRAHIILLLADGHPWATIAAVLFCSTRTIGRWQQRFQASRLHGLHDRPRGPKPPLAASWAAVVVAWATVLTPRAFGFIRSRWCCAVMEVDL